MAADADSATLVELKEAVKETLDKRGALKEIKARIRAEIFHALDDSADPKPPLSNTNLIINELIREYLKFNGYHHTNSVFIPETGQPDPAPFDQSFLAQQLNIPLTTQTSEIPLLYTLVTLLRTGGGGGGGGGVGETRSTTAPATRKNTTQRRQQQQQQQ